MVRLNIDEDMLKRAVKAGGHKTVDEAVTVALEWYIARHMQLEIAEVSRKKYDDPEKWRRKQ